MWYKTFNDFFWMSIAGMVIGFLLKYRWYSCSCCGINIFRDNPIGLPDTTPNITPVLSRSSSMINTDIPLISRNPNNRNPEPNGLEIQNLNTF